MTTKNEYFLRRREGEYSLDAFSATLPASEGSAVVCPLLHGFALALLGYHPRLSMVRLRRRRQLLCTAMTMAVEAEQWWSIDRAVGGVGHRLYIDFFRCV